MKARYDAVPKVTGQAQFASDRFVPGLLVSALVTSAIAKGRIAAIDTTEAATLPGVVAIYTWRNAPSRKPLPFFAKGGIMTISKVPLTTPEINFDGEIVAMVVAESFEIASEAAGRVKISYDSEQPRPLLDSVGSKPVPVSEAVPGYMDICTAAQPEPSPDVKTIKVSYRTPAHNHSMMEIYSTTAVWSSDRLTIYEPSQYVGGLKHGVAAQLGIPSEQVEIVSPYTGGAFGAYCAMSPLTGLAAAAARELRRPVRLRLTRDQHFSLLPSRAETRHDVELTSGWKGDLQSYTHDSVELCTSIDDYFTGGVGSTALMYQCARVRSQLSIVRADRSQVGWMRAPFEFSYFFALESAVDETAHELGMDPIEFRRKNDAERSPLTGVPYSSRGLMRCFDEGKRKFGWENRQAPGTRLDGDWLVGIGCATSSYPALTRASAARVRLTASGRALVQVAAHEIGQGAYTVLADLTAEELGIEPGNVTVELGSSGFPPSICAGGAWTTASVGSAIHLACEAIRTRLGRKGSVSLLDAMEAALLNVVEEYAEFTPPASPREMANLYHGALMAGGGTATPPEPDPPPPVMRSFGAQFVEVRVHVRTCEVKVSRMLGIFAAGRIVNEQTSRSQLIGGMIWGLSSALRESVEIDETSGRVINDNLADYILAVQGDVPEVEVIMLPEADEQVNALGIKGIGELGNVGTAAAIANAVFNATGRRVRDLPIRFESLL